MSTQELLIRLVGVLAMPVIIAIVGIIMVFDKSIAKPWVSV